jgi:hypothetical protein
MAGRLTISTLNDDTGVLATQNGMNGIAKAWVNFDGVAPVSIRASFNVSSVTRNSTGNYTINFTTAMPDANYSYALSGKQSGADWSNMSPVSGGATTTTFRIATFNGDNTPSSRDYDLASVSIFR